MESKVKRKRKRESIVDETEEDDQAVNKKEKRSESSDFVEEEAPSASTKVKKGPNPFKTIGKSWLPHIANLILLKVLNSIPPDFDGLDSLHLTKSDWNDWAGSILSADDLQAILCYISKEFPGTEDLLRARQIAEPYQSIDELIVKFKKPMAPVKPFFQFMKSRKKDLAKKHPELSPAEINEKLEAKWDSMDEKRRKKYEERYEKDKERYSTELEQFYTDYPQARPLSPKKTNKRAFKKPQNGEEELKQAKEQLKKLKSMAPKPPVTAFFIFCKSKRAVMTANCPELTSQQVTKSLSETWNNLSEVNKDIYKQMYLTSKQEYSEKMTEFNESHPGIMEQINELDKRIKSTHKR